MTETSYTIKTMTRADLDRAINWAAAEGWNPGKHDASNFYAADENGFFIGRLGDEPVASISAVKYGASFGFIGLYIVKPDYRGQGLGIKIWHAAMDYLTGRNIGLDGVLDQQANYTKSGFNFAYSNIRYAGEGDGATPDHDPGLVQIDTLPAEQVINYDRAFFPDDRARFTRHWIAQPDATALGILKNQTLTGYGVIRPCLSGWKIGPLFADTPDIAHTLFRALKSRVKPGEPFYLDTPETNREAVALAEGANMQPVFQTARMYTGHPPALPLPRIFGVTSFELG